MRPCEEPLTISTIFSRAGAWVEAWRSCWDWVLLGCRNVCRRSVLHRRRENHTMSDHHPALQLVQPLCVYIPPVLGWSKQVLVESWGRAAAALGSSSSGSQGLPGRRERGSQAEARCFEGHPAGRRWEANWPCWCNRAGKERWRRGHERGREYGRGKKVCNDTEDKIMTRWRKWPQKPQGSEFGRRGKWSKSEKTKDLWVLFPF